MPDKKTFKGTIGRTIAETEFKFDIQESPAKGKPNVIYIVLDDLGFSHLHCYGSNIDTPNFDRLAENGLRYNNFHTTAVCAATRASLLTGANHHSVGIANVPEFATGLENGIGEIHPQYATMAEILREYDYRTIAVGKWHLNKAVCRTADGPFDTWPLGKGFESYYGFLGAATDQWTPDLIRDNTPVTQPKSPKDGYHLSEDLADNAIQYIYRHHFAHPEQPFFLYLAYGATHSALQAPKEYVDKYRGKFDKGWDEIRREWFENQKRIGIVNENAELTDRNECVEAWDSLSADQKKAYARYMELFAGFLEHTDTQVGRLLDYLEEAELLEDTVIVFLSDNGASAEGGQDGHVNCHSGMDTRGSYPHEVALTLQNYENLGGYDTAPHYPVGWANAGNTPFPWYKAWVHEGGVKDPMIISYPRLIHDKGGIRRQYAHVTDITPTVLDILGLEKPKMIKGVPQKPLQGISFLNTFEDEHAEARKKVQYFEMFGNRAIYKDGWKAVVNHIFHESFDEDEWELYHVEADYSEKYNVADKYPEKLQELKEEFLIQAAKYGVFPMPAGGVQGGSDELFDKFAAMQAPAKVWSYKHVRYPFDIPEDPGLATRSHTFTAVLDRKSQTEEGVLFSKGERSTGVSFYVKDNRLKYVYNSNREKYFIAESDRELPLGKVTVSLTFTVVGRQKAEVVLFIDGQKTGEVLVEAFSVAMSTSLKYNPSSSVYEKDYQAPFEYTGVIDEITIDVPASNIDPLEELKRDLHND